MRFQPLFAASLFGTMALGGCSCEEANGSVDDLEVGSELVDFGVVLAGAECRVELPLTNRGSTTVRFASHQIVEGDSVFGIDLGAPSLLTAGQMVPVPLLYTPTNAGTTDHGTLAVNFDVGGRTDVRNVALVGYAVAQRSARIDARCEDAAGEAGVFGPCPKVVIDNVQQGQSGAAVVKLHNLGTDVLHLSRVTIEAATDRWRIERAFFKPPNELEEEVIVPSEEGAEPLAVRNVVTGDCGQELSGDEDVPLMLDISYVAREVGADEAELVLITDDPFNPELRIPLQGIGNGRRGEIEPKALVVNGGDSSEVTIRSTGNTAFPINSVFIDFDMDGEKGPDDYGCRPGTRSEDEGPLTCASASGSGFSLEPFDGAEGGRDEATIVVSHWGGAPERAQLVFKSNTPSVSVPGGRPGLFIVPIGTAADAQLNVSAAGALQFVENQGLYSGSVELTVHNPGGAATEISGWTFLGGNGAPVGEDNWLMNATTMTVAGEEVAFPVTLDAGQTVTVTMAMAGAAESTWPSDVHMAVYHDAVAATPFALRIPLARP